MYEKELDEVIDKEIKKKYKRNNDSKRKERNPRKKRNMKKNE